jgi:hypothetical protein
MSPVPLLLVLITTLHAAVAHAIAGKTLLQLPVFWLASLLGVVLVHAVGLSFGSAFPAPANVHLIETSIGAWIGIIIAARVSTTPS